MSIWSEHWPKGREIGPIEEAQVRLIQAALSPAVDVINAAERCGILVKLTPERTPSGSLRIRLETRPVVGADGPA